MAPLKWFYHLDIQCLLVGESAFYLVSFDFMINTIFEIGHYNNALPQFDWLPSFNLTFRISPCLSAKISTICAISHWFWIVRIIFQQINISSLKAPLIFWPLLVLMQGDKEYFVPSIPKLSCYMWYYPPLFAAIYISTFKFRGRHRDFSLNSKYVRWSYRIKAVAITLQFCH